MIRIHSDGQKVVTNYDYDVEKIYPINHNSFVIQEKDNNCIRLLTINYEGTTFFTDKLLFRESTHQIVKILADKNNLFVLSKLGVNYIFRYFILDDNMELKSNGTIENIEENHKSFIQEFDRSMIINHNILISNDQKLVKIYGNNDGKSIPQLQNYFNFLPNHKDDEKDRCMPILNLRNCPKHKRLLM